MAGLQVWDIAGNLIVEEDSPAGRFLGKVWIYNQVNPNGTIFDPAITFADGDPFHFIETNSLGGHPTVVFSEGRLDWYQGVTNTGALDNFFRGRLRYGMG